MKSHLTIVVLAFISGLVIGSLAHAVFSRQHAVAGVLDTQKRVEDKPTEEDGRTAILNLIRKYGGTDAVKLVKFRRTNGILHLPVLYSMKYEYELEVVRDWDSGTWLLKGIIKSGHRVNVREGMRFQKTDNGWQFETLEGREDYSCTVTP